MHAFAANSNGDVDAVVDQEWNIGCSRDFVKLFGNDYQFGSIADLVTVLYDCDTFNMLAHVISFWCGVCGTEVPPSTAALTMPTRSRPRRIASVESLTK